MDILGRKTREPTVRSIGMDDLLTDLNAQMTESERTKRASDRLRLQQLLAPLGNACSSSMRATRGSGLAGGANQNKVLRLDTEGREKERRKVSNRENFVDTGLPYVAMSMSRDDEVYEYDSSAENSVHYLNGGEPVPSLSRSYPDRRPQRTVDTIIPTVPRLGVPTNSHDVSFGSRDSRDTEGGGHSSPLSSRSEKLQRTLKNISLNEREPFPGVRARIAKQREKEKAMKKSHDRKETTPTGNSNNNAMSDSETSSAPVKPSHAEEEAVRLNSSPESVVVRPIKRKVATAPDLTNRYTKSATGRAIGSSSSTAAASRKPDGVSRSKSADVRRPNPAPKWVDKTPGKPRSTSAQGDKHGPRKPTADAIRPDSWRKGMAVVKQQLKQKQSGPAARHEDRSRPNSARSTKSDSSDRMSGVARQVLEELRDSDSEREPDDADAKTPTKDDSKRPKRRLKVKVAEPEVIEPAIKQRHYDTQSVQEFMAKKKKEKRQQEIEEKKKKQLEEKARKEKLRLLQDRSRRVVRKSTIKPPPSHAARQPSNATFTSACTAGLASVPTTHPEPPIDGVWAPLALNSASYTVRAETENAKQWEAKETSYHADSRLSEESEGEGDTTLTESELQVETPTKQSRPGSKSSTPRSKPDSPLMARTKAVEEEIEQLVQAAKLRNQSARQIQAQATPLKLIDQLASSDTTTSSYRYSPPTAKQCVKSARIASLTLTTAQLMSKMNMLKADLEQSALSRSNSRAASSLGQWLNTSLSPREPVDSAPGPRLTYGYVGREALVEDRSDSSATVIATDEDDEDHTHSTVTDSSKTHSTVTSDSEVSDNESELSSLDLRIREALARPNNISSAHVRAQAIEPKEIVKPIARVARSLHYDDTARGDGHSVINTYLRKLKADREALSMSGLSKSTPTTCHPVTSSYLATSTITTQTSATLTNTGMQTDIPKPAPTAFITSRLSDSNYTVPPPVTLSQSLRTSSTFPVAQEQAPKTHLPTVTSAGGSVDIPTIKTGHVTSATQSAYNYPVTSQSRLSSPPAYTTRTQAPTSAQAARISPAGLDLALSAGISLLEGMGQQQVQLSDVERTRFSTLAQQETVALAQILKGNKERQEQHLMNLRQKIKQDEIETQQKLVELRKEAELANQRREHAEKQSENEAHRLSKDATRRVLEAQNESTKAFTEAARLLADRRERLADSESHLADSARSVVDTLRVQSDAVTASLTSLVDQQRHQNLEMLRLARLEPQGQRVADVKSPNQERMMTKSPRPKTRTRSPIDAKSPRSSKAQRDSNRSPRDSRSPRPSKSPRSRKLRSPKDRSFQDILERSDLSTTSSRQSDETIRTDSIASYSDDFGSPSEKSSHSKSPPVQRKSPVQTKSPLHSKSHSTVTESVASDPGRNSIESSIKTASDLDSLPSPVKDNSINTDPSDHSNKEDSAPAREGAVQGSRATTEADDRGDKPSKYNARYSDGASFTSPGSSTGGDSPLHKVVLGAVKEVFKDGSPAQLQSDPAFYDKLKSVLYTLKDGGPTPAALSTPCKNSPLSSPSKPPMVAPLSPRFDRRLTMRRPVGQRPTKRSSFPVDSESDESHSLLETASDTDQECQLSALQHQLDEAKKRHAMMKKARQKYEFQKKQDAYKKQIEYYEEDMIRMKKEMDDLTAMHAHAAGGTASASSTGLSVSIRPQIKHPRAPSSSGSDNGRQRHSSGTSDAELPTPQPTALQKHLPLVGKSLGQLSSGRPAYDRQRSDSGKSLDSEVDSKQREKTVEQYGDDFESDVTSKSTKDTSKQSSTAKDPSRQAPAVKPAPEPEGSQLQAKDTPRTETEGDFPYSNGFEEGNNRRLSSASESIAESIIESINESLQSSKRLSDSSMSQASDLLNFDELSNQKLGDTSADVSPMKVQQAAEPSLLLLSTDASDAVFTEQSKLPAASAEGRSEEVKPRSRTVSDSSTHTLTEAKSDSRSATPTWSKSERSRSPSPTDRKSRSRSRTSSGTLKSRSSSRRSRSRSASRRSRSRSTSRRSRSRSISGRSRSISRGSRSRSTSRRSRSSGGRSRSRSTSLMSKSPGSRSRTHSRSSRSRSRSPNKSVSEASIVSEVASVASASVHAGDQTDDEKPLLDLGDLSGSLDKQSPEPAKLDIQGDDSASDKPLLDLTTAPDLTATPEVTAAEGQHSKVKAEPSDQGDGSSERADSAHSYRSDFSSERDEHKSRDNSESSGSSKSRDSSFSSEKSLVDATTDQPPSSVRSPDQLVVQSPVEVKGEGDDIYEAGASAIDELLVSAYEENFGSTQPQEPLLSLKDELAAALADADEEKVGDEVTSPPPQTKADLAELQPGDRLAQSTPRVAVADSEEKEQRDFDELEKLMTENSSGDSKADQSEDSSRISLGSKSPDFLDFSHTSHDKQQGIPDKDKAGENKSDDESELDKVISSAAAAVESFATDIDLDELNHTESQGDVGLSVMEETTPRSLMSLDSSADDLLDDTQATAKVKSPDAVDAPRVDMEKVPLAETSVKVADAEPEADESEKSIREADDSQLDAACTDLIAKSLDTVLDLWKEKRQSFTDSSLQIASSLPPLQIPSSEVEASATGDSASLEKVIPPTSQESKSPTKQEATSPAKQEVPPLAGHDSVAFPIKEKQSDKQEQDKENLSPKSDSSTTTSSHSLLGALPPLHIKPVKTSQSSAAKSPTDGLSPPSSEESVSPQKSPTKSMFPSFVEEARHEQWAQLDKGEIDSLLGVTDSDWFDDDDFGLGTESKPSSSIVPTKEILSRVAPEPVFIVPHQESEVKALADEVLDLFWQARRCGESWDDLMPTKEFLDTGDKLELEASSNAAFKQFVFDLVRDMLSDIYQNEDVIDPQTAQAIASATRGPLGKHYRHRQPPTTLDEVREIIRRQIYPAVTGKLIHPSKSARVTSVVRHKRRDKVDTILIQELREEEQSWLDYTHDEQGVKDSLVTDIFKVLLDDGVSAILGAYNKKQNIQPTTEL